MSACSIAAKEGTTEYSFKNPPLPGTSIQSQPMMVFCKTIDQAMAMSASGLFVPGCVRATEKQYQIRDVTRLSLAEGDVWMAAASDGQALGYIPFPWHDWV